MSTSSASPSGTPELKVPDPRRELGRRGEDAAAAWYEEAGYEVRSRNWRCSDGEIDLVVADADALVICEVKTRRSGSFGSPLEAVTQAKIRRLRRLAAAWLAENPLEPLLGGADVHGEVADGGYVGDGKARTVGRRTIRFDVAAVTVDAGGGLVIDIVEGAF